MSSCCGGSSGGGRGVWLLPAALRAGAVRRRRGALRPHRLVPWPPRRVTPACHRAPAAAVCGHGKPCGLASWCCGGSSSCCARGSHAPPRVLAPATPLLQLRRRLLLLLAVLLILVQVGGPGGGGSMLVSSCHAQGSGGRAHGLQHQGCTVIAAIASASIATILPCPAALLLAVPGRVRGPRCPRRLAAWQQPGTCRAWTRGLQHHCCLPGTCRLRPRAGACRLQPMRLP